jgi:hypothetical protein
MNNLITLCANCHEHLHRHANASDATSDQFDFSMLAILMRGGGKELSNHSHITTFVSNILVINSAVSFHQSNAERSTATPTAKVRRGLIYCFASLNSTDP